MSASSRILFVTGPVNAGKTALVEHLAAADASLNVISPLPWLRNLSTMATPPGVPRNQLIGGDGVCDLADYVSNNWKEAALMPLVFQHIESMLKRFKTTPATSDSLVVVDGFPLNADEAHLCMWLAAQQGYEVAVVALHVAADEFGALVAREEHGTRYPAKLTVDELRAQHQGYLADFDALRQTLPAAMLSVLRCATISAEQAAKAAPQVARYHNLCTGELASEWSIRAQSVERRLAVIRAGFADRNRSAAEQENSSSGAAVAPSSLLGTAVDAVCAAEVVQMQQRLAGEARRKRTFCGTYPISLEREPHMRNLLCHPYLCAPKRDGVRFMLVVRNGHCYFMNRRLVVWRGPAPLENNPETEGPLARFNGTLLDGELCVLNEEDTRCRFYVLDALCVAGRSEMNAPILQRVTAASELLRCLNRLSDASFQFAAQEYVARFQLGALMKRMQQQEGGCGYEGGTDGIIFVPEKLPYRRGIDHNLYKWKVEQQNTVDLLLAEDGTLYSLLANHDKTGDRQFMDKPLRYEGALPVAQLPDGRRLDAAQTMQETRLRPFVVYECRWKAPSELNPKGAWMPQAARTDKCLPNMDWTVARILKSIADDIRAAELVRHCEQGLMSRRTQQRQRHAAERRQAAQQRQAVQQSAQQRQTAQRPAGHRADEYRRQASDKAVCYSPYYDVNRTYTTAEPYDYRQPSRYKK